MTVKYMATLIAEIAEKYPFSMDIQILKAVDKELWEKENVITSDSIILDHCKSWVNLMAKSVEKNGAQVLQVWE